MDETTITTNFDPVLFDESGDITTIDTKTYPYVYNDRGTTHHIAQPKGKLIQQAQEKPDERLGRVHHNITWRVKEIPTKTSSYTITGFDFGVDSVVYEPMLATWETAQAFGITLLRDGECMEFRYDGMISQDYTYGIYAGYQSPYIDLNRRLELLPINPTDLEYHAFAHIFCSQDPSGVHLVTSVARFRPLERTIWLADLWVSPGHCLVIPPKPVKRPDYAAPAYTDVRENTYYDMHGNRNSAQACRYVDGKTSLKTNTTLGDSAVFSADATKPHYHEEKHPTVHSKPPGV
jgi:hypothetical protein